MKLSNFSDCRVRITYKQRMLNDSNPSLITVKAYLDFEKLADEPFFIYHPLFIECLPHGSHNSWDTKVNETDENACPCGE